VVVAEAGVVLEAVALLAVVGLLVVPEGAVVLPGGVSVELPEGVSEVLLEVSVAPAGAHSEVLPKVVVDSEAQLVVVDLYQRGRLEELLSS